MTPWPQLLPIRSTAACYRRLYPRCRWSTLFFVLVALKKRVWVAALSGLLMAVALALLVFGMPAVLVATAAGHGFIFGLMRIAWIVVASIFLYNVASTTGQFQVMKDSIAGLSSDKRLQLVLIAFCFGAFLEGTGGGGAPVAIAGAFLIGLGFHPFQAATLCLLANTAPVAWGGVGNPIRVLAGVTGLPEAQFSAMAGRILPPISLILPLWLVRSMVGWRETWQVWPALLVSGASFAAMQFYWSNFQEPGLVDIVSAIVSLLVTVAFLAASLLAIAAVSALAATILASPAGRTCFPVTGCVPRKAGMSTPATIRLLPQPWKMSVFISGKRRISRIFHTPPSLTKRFWKVATSHQPFSWSASPSMPSSMPARPRLVAAGRDLDGDVELDPVVELAVPEPGRAHALEPAAHARLAAPHALAADFDDAVVGEQIDDVVPHLAVLRRSRRPPGDCGCGPRR